MLAFGGANLPHVPWGIQPCAIGQLRESLQECGSQDTSPLP
jgi:hypothetical protein